MRELKQQLTELDILWVGSAGGMEQALVKRAGLTFEAISAGGLRGKNLMAFLRGLWALSQGYRQSLQVIERYQPDILLATGGYVCAPVTLAARRSGLPVLIYLPDIEPGLAIKFLARFANRVAVTVPEAQQFFRPGLTVVTGYPVRPALVTTFGSGKAAARLKLGLTERLPVLLVFGGSQGARSINRSLTDRLEDYLEVSQIIHVTGVLDEAWVQAKKSKLPQNLQARYHVAAYLHNEMVAALVAADLVVSRAGASTLGEFPAVGLPAIVVPYPYAGAHQALNANYLVQHQAAIIVENADLEHRLKDTVINLITDQEKLQAMSQACRNLAQPDAAARLAKEIISLHNG